MSGRLNLDHQANNWLSVGLTMNLARTENQRLPDDNAFSNPLQMAALTPLTPFLDPNTGLPAGTPPGDINIPLYYNPIISINYAKFVATSIRNLTNGYLQANIFKGLKFRSEVGVDLLNQQEEGYFQSQTVRNQTRATNGIGSNYGTFVTNYNTNNFFAYDNSFGQHGISATLGMSYQQSQTKTNFVEGTQFPSNSYQRIASAATKSDGSSTETNFGSYHILPVPTINLPINTYSRPVHVLTVLHVSGPTHATVSSLRCRWDGCFRKRTS